MNRTITTKALRASWSDAKRAGYLMEREIERSFKKDPVGKAYMTELLEVFMKHLANDDIALEKTERLDSAVSLAGSNNFDIATFKRKFADMIPAYQELMNEQGIDVQLIEKRRVIAHLLPALAANENTPFVERRKQA